MRVWENIFHANGNQKKAGAAILISDKTDLKDYKEGHYVIITESIQEEDITIVNMAPHSSTPAWKIPWMEEPGRLQSMGSLRIGHD